ncbi:MAG: hypothetical protein OXB89_02260 [Anaerolineaceae bacterium]|nr:hypothetical protein [Anaerolineaceae bacterium]
MMRSFFTMLAVLLALTTALVTLAGLLLERRPVLLAGALATWEPLIREWSATLLQVFSISVAVSIMIGILNLLLVHLRRSGRRETGCGYSFVLFLSAATVIGLTYLERENLLTTGAEWRVLLLEQVQVTVESSLAGLLLFGLVYGAWRVMALRVNGWGSLFVLTVLLVLGAALPLPELAPLVPLRDWLLAVPVNAGARGILLGIALATIVVGARVLIGQDRSLRSGRDE